MHMIRDELAKLIEEEKIHSFKVPDTRDYIYRCALIVSPQERDLIVDSLKENQRLKIALEEAQAVGCDPSMKSRSTENSY